MPEREIRGVFIVEGPDDRIDLVERAIDRLDKGVSVDHFIKDKFNVVFRAVKNVPGTHKPAYGFFLGGIRQLQIRHGMQGAGTRDLRKQEVMYTFLHEALGHGGELDGVLTRAKRVAIMEAMGIPLAGVDPRVAWNRGTTPAGVQMNYWDRPYEAYCDLLVSAVSDVPSLFERKYTWDIDPDVLKEIVMRDAPADQVPDPIESPDPLDVLPPKGDDCADLKERLDVITAERNSFAEKIATLKQRAAELANI